MAADTDVTIQIECLCKANKFSTAVPIAALPFKALLCHCTSCRRVTGALYTCFSQWPGTMQDVLDSSLQSYQYTSDTSLKFCGRCSSPMFLHLKKSPDPSDPGVLIFYVGLLPNTVPGLPSGVQVVSIQQQVFAGDTGDGGASVFLQRPNADGKLIKRWHGYYNVSEELPADWPPQSLLAEAGARPRQEEVSIQCHCKGVDFVMCRGDKVFAEMKAAGNLPGWVVPDSLKPMALFDACDSCRFQFGTPLMNWTFAQLTQLHFAPGASGSADTAFPASTIDLKAAVAGGNDSRYGTLAFYESSPDVQRYYCSRCSATVFYAVDDLPSQVDVAIGLFHATEGARTDSWVEWDYGGMGHNKDAVGGWREGFADAVKQGAEEWRASRDIPKARRSHA